ncbi:thiolase family protein [Congregibacter litoralis]|uniref:Acetyl-CoA acetyltransferase n=1 Tax=Congregibacter litoralis KT71 TaxID=314285 RepID=A4ABB0_9GAMM|nr:thiolase family protein [Congregibacter litoralis]EAQ96664.1 Acetyl-CoA acetyltransferase [Congregibacter litoralis KT71]
MSDIFIAGVGMTQFGRHLDRSYKDLTRESVEQALADAGAEKSQVRQAYFGSCVVGFMQDQHMIPGQVALRSMGFEGIPIFNVEGACASATSALYLAAQAIRAGSCDIALAVGTEKMNSPDKARMFAAFDSAWDVSCVEHNKEILLRMGEGIDPPAGSQSQKPYSMFMDVYAAFCRLHMKTFGTTQRQIASVSAKNHSHSVHNPLSQYQQPYSIDEVMHAPPITYPLTLPMCAPISDGSAAAVICNSRGLASLNGTASRAVRLLSSVVRSGSSRGADEYKNHLTALAAAEAYEQAGISPAEVDVAEVHDATAMGEIIQAENLQLVPYGEAGPAAERGDFTVGGRVPINPSGGLESKGHPIGATGLGQVYELVTQLRGEAGARQVAGARVAVQENGGGIFGVEEATAVINVFSK